MYNQSIHWGRDKMNAISQTTFLKCVFQNENVWIPIKFSLKFIPKGPINNIPALVQIMAWCRSGDKPLSELMMVRLLKHICVIRPQWVKMIRSCITSSHTPTRPLVPWTGSAWFQIMACRLYSAKPLPKPMATNCQLDHKGTNFNDIWTEIHFFSFMKMYLEISSAKSRPLYGEMSQLSGKTTYHQWPLLLAWFNFNPSMDKLLNPL